MIASHMIKQISYEEWRMKIDFDIIYNDLYQIV